MSDASPADATRRGEPPATLGLEAASARAWEVVVIGAGPAGSAVAARLAARGLGVLLIDATTMPRPKLCGCCLSPTALAELAALDRLAADGPRRSTATRGVPLERLRLATAAVTAVVPMRGGSAVSREALDAEGVRRAITAGAFWLPRVRATTVVEGGDGVTIGVAAADAAGDGWQATRVTGRLVIVAAGLADAIRGAVPEGRVIAADSRVGLGTTLPGDAGGPPPGELVMAVARGGYCGVVRLEDGRIDIAAALDRGVVAAAGSPAAAIALVLAEAGGDRAAGLATPDATHRLATAAYRGSPMLTRRRSVASPTGRILRVGDAAGYVEPFTGEGMGWALVSARLCDAAMAPLVSGGGRLAGDVAAAAIRYAQSHGRHFASHHARCRRVSLVVRRPWLVGPALRLARLAPAVAARVVPLVTGGATSPEAHG